MKVIYKNTTKYTKEIYSEFLQFHQKKYGLKALISTIIISILILYCMITCFIGNEPLIGFIFLAGGIGFITYRYFGPLKFIKKEYNSKKITNENEFTFTFYKHYMKLEGTDINKKVRYWTIKKAYENNKYYYLYIDKNYAFVLKKNGFAIGDSKTFLPFIKKKILFKI